MGRVHRRMFRSLLLCALLLLPARLTPAQVEPTPKADDATVAEADSPAQELRLDQSPRDMARLLGTDLEGAAIVAVLGRKLMHIDLKTGRITPLYEHHTRTLGEWTSRPYFSPDGRKVLFAVEDAARQVDVATQHVDHLLSDRLTAEPQYWTDPKTGERCIIYMDRSGQYNWPEDRDGAATWRYRMQSGTHEKLLDFPCDSGLSPDGHYLADAVGGAVLFDLRDSRARLLHRGDIACNGSSSPDNSHRVMHLYWPHTTFGIKNPYDRELWSIRVPRGSNEWDHPRWSNHPDYCTAIVVEGISRYLAVVKISTRQVAVLYHLGSGWAFPQGWLPSGTAAAKTPVLPFALPRLYRHGLMVHVLAGHDTWTELLETWARSGDSELLALRSAVLAWGERSLSDADHGPDADQADAVLQELAVRFKGHRLGDQASTRLVDEHFRGERFAVRRLRDLVDAAGRLTSPADADEHVDDAAYHARHEATLQVMAELALELRSQWPESEASIRSDEIASHFGLPIEWERTASPRLVVKATVVAVSAVPTPAAIAPYREAITFIRYRVDEVREGSYTPRTIVIAHWGMKDGRFTPAADLKPGMQQVLACDHFDSHPSLQSVHWADDASVDELPAYWALEVHRPDDE